MKDFINWLIDTKVTSSFVIRPREVTITGYCNKELIEQALEFGCKGIEAESSNELIFHF